MTCHSTIIECLAADYSATLSHRPLVFHRDNNGDITLMRRLPPSFTPLRRPSRVARGSARQRSFGTRGYGAAQARVLCIIGCVPYAASTPLRQTRFSQSRLPLFREGWLAEMFSLHWQAFHARPPSSLPSSVSSSSVAMKVIAHMLSVAAISPVTIRCHAGHYARCLPTTPRTEVAPIAIP